MFLKSVTSHALGPPGPLPLSQNVTPSRTPSPSSVMYFMDGPYGLSASTLQEQLPLFSLLLESPSKIWLCDSYLLSLGHSSTSSIWPFLSLAIPPHPLSGLYGNRILAPFFISVHSIWRDAALVNKLVPCALDIWSWRSVNMNQKRLTIIYCTRPSSLGLKVWNPSRWMAHEACYRIVRRKRSSPSDPVTYTNSSA